MDTHTRWPYAVTNAIAENPKEDFNVIAPEMWDALFETELGVNP